MKLTLSIKTLFRSLLKTLLTFVLLAAASFMLVYSAADYAMSIREFQRAVSNYRGIASVEFGTPERPSQRAYIIDDTCFLLTDPRSPAEPDELYIYEDYHHGGFSQENIDYILSLPYITSYNLRFMTAGVSEDYYRIDNVESFFNNAARFVYEATLDNYEDAPLENTIYQLHSEFENHREYELYISDINVLAGDPEWPVLPEYKYFALSGQRENELSDSHRRIRAITTTPEFIDYFPYIVNFISDYRFLIFYRQNMLAPEQLEILVPGERYIFVGRIDPTTNSWQNTSHRSAIGDDTLLDWWPYIYPLKDLPENHLELEEFAPLRELIQITNDDLHTFDVVYTDDMDTIRRVRDDKIIPVEGRFLTPEDSENKNPVCVVSDVFMKEYGLSLGDTVKLKLGDELFEQYAPLGAVASCRERYADKFVDAEFEIVGSYMDINLQKIRETDLYWAYSDNTIFVPLSFLPAEESELEAHEFKPGEISFVVGDAGNIRPFVEECIPRLEDMGLTVYFSDGGWLRIEEQVRQAGSVSLSKLLAFGAACILASALTVYLFISRKKREYAVMRALGTPKSRAGRALFVPLMLLAIVAIILGGAAAAIYTERNAANTLREFSELGLDVDTSVPLPVTAYGVLGELVLLVVLTVAGLRRLSKKPPLMLLQENTNRNTKPMNSDAAESGNPAEFSIQTPQNAIIPEPGRVGAVQHVLRYIAKHGRRAKAKSLLSILLAVLLSGAMGQFTAVRKTYGELYRNIEIKARFINGIPYSRALKVADSGYVHSPYYEYFVKEGEVNFEFTEICVTNNIGRITNEPIEFLEGYEKDTVMTLKEKICVISGSLMDALGIEPGDIVELQRYNHLGDIMFNHPEYTEQEALEVYHRQSVDCMVVGRVETESLGDIVIVPAAAELYLRTIINPFALDLAEYTLNDYHMADEFRAYAKEIVDSVRNDPPMFLMDTSEADNIYRIYKLIETLYPIAAVVAVLIGGVLPGLVILQSAKEASIMRVLGTTKRRTRLTLITEQLILCLLGLILALAALAAFNGASILTVALQSGVYIALHFIGCAIGAAVCAVVVTKRRILELLQVKE